MSSLSISAPSSAKPKPTIPPKPSFDGGDPPPQDEAVTPTPAGKVKKIVDSLSQGQAVVNTAPPEPKVVKRAPTVKPKPKSKLGAARLEEAGQAPPLPEKQSRRLQQAHAARLQGAPPTGEEGNDIGVEGGRSAPDGKEVELQLLGGGGAEAEPCGERPLAPTCAPRCGCVCHLRRPGMRLVWVPSHEGGGEREGEGEGADQSDGVDGEVEEGGGEEGEGQSGGGEEEEEEAGDRTRKALFHHTLNAVISDTHRRRSDPGLNSLLRQQHPPRSPPVPSKRTHSSLAKLGPPPGEEEEEEEEESIYEITLPLTTPPSSSTTPPTASCRELDLPLIRVRKPQRRTKLTPSFSDPNSEFQPQTEAAAIGDAAPPVPERVPMTPRAATAGGVAPPHAGARPPPPPHAAAVARPPRHLGGPAGAELSTPPGSPPMFQRRAPLLPPPRTDPRRLSSASTHSLTSTKEEENGCAEEDENKGEEEEEEEARPVAPPRRGSSFKWSRLQDEPLYQTYRATVITKEIKRQTVGRNISKASADYTMDWFSRRLAIAPAAVTPGPPAVSSPLSAAAAAASNGVSRLGPGPPMPGGSTLWQDLPAVRDSGVLENISPEDCKYQESMFEVLTSEASYLRSLRVLTNHFHESRDLEEAMIIRDRKTLFSNVLRVREVSERFLKDLEDRMEQNLVFTDICDIIHYHAQHNFPVYIDYVRNQIYQEKTYTTLMKSSAQFAEVISRLQESPLCQRLPFMSFLLLPFQRITRIKMLIENILKRTKEQTKEEQTASKALDSVSKIIEECNTEVGKMKQVEELIVLSKMLEFDKLKALPIISQNRNLEKKGELGEMSKGATLFNMRAKFSPVHLFLFNDLLILASKKGPERFVVLDYAHRSLVQVEPVVEGPTGPALYENCFTLTLLENHQGRLMERLLKAPSQSDLHRWVVAFPNPSNPERDVEEVIYEDWDCPQVQCVEQYVAGQTDELSLEPTEIINVLRKTNEGWYEGSRLSDGQKGWFPVSSVVEITNEHVRRRNLRERYRVMQAASQVANLAAAQVKAKTGP
ncbi:LOW QUALITY PROTEIN: rho guanine nucleotide exchange factor 15 [Gadus morhua]|uniref:LOW QUALITY PROTEIN: rho guanine nucleotide exchange factor 15 n=1 Tax=Gadus morhua TaxID=8049 RepID=UPI0011B85CAF|nr:LOW QUALITY PROTEIN: rho guanine nucleotide exchange factor 15-like [Gadus morhua]